MKGLGKEEFAKIFFGYNFTSSDVKENEKHQEILNYLLIAVIEKYSQTELLRYFFSKDISQKENRPEYSNSSSIVNYCLQLISYWLRQIRNKPVYELKTEHAGIADSIQYIKISSNKNYVDNYLNDVFKQHLAILRERAFPLQSVISRVNSSNDQDYHQQLLDKEKESERIVRMLRQKEQELEKAESLLTSREKANEALKEQLIQNKSINAEVLEIYREERAALKDQEGSIRQHKELMAKERAAFKTKNERLQEKISVLESQLLEKEANIETFKEKEQAFEERLSTITATVEKKLQDEKEVLMQQQEKLLEKEQSLQERLNALTTSEENFLERRGLLNQDRQEMEKQKKDLEKEIKVLKETISKLKENKLDEKNYIRLIEDENFKLLTGIEELVNDGDVVSSTSSGVSSGSIGSEQSLQASSSAFFKLAANNPDLQNQTITLVK